MTADTEPLVCGLCGAARDEQHTDTCPVFKGRVHRWQCGRYEPERAA